MTRRELFATAILPFMPWRKPWTFIQANPDRVYAVGTYGAITRSTYIFWRNQRLGSSPVLDAAAFQRADDNCTRGDV